MTKPHSPFTILFLLITAYCLLITSSVHAQSPAITRNDAILDFPDTVTFTLQLDDASSIRSAALIYDLAQFTCL
ncbi:MAG: hypothetical protein KC415_19090, partial [Anaerolineales bacterium]|nr:hypothetical protein [Anaerolineales bacterium]